MLKVDFWLSQKYTYWKYICFQHKTANKRQIYVTIESQDLTVIKVRKRKKNQNNDLQFKDAFT